MAALIPYKRIVIKIGSALLVDPISGQIRTEWLQQIVNEIHVLREHNIDVLIVSSGAIALGRKRLGLSGKSLTLTQNQACAAAGQSLLTQAYEHALAPLGHVTAQALLTLNDTENRRRYLNAKDTLGTLLSLRAIPVINENDTVATDEIRYGDNDRLAARVAAMIEADLLILLSDVDGLYESNPHENPKAQHFPVIESITPAIMAMGEGPNSQAGTGTGGMATKLQAAQIATQAGCEMLICQGDRPDPILGALENKHPTTLFRVTKSRQAAKKTWLAAHLHAHGTITIDEGAKKALQNGKSLLLAGVTAIAGQFQKGDPVDIVGPNGQTLARGLSAYDDTDSRLIMGQQSGDIEAILGYSGGPVLIHRDNMVILA